MSRPDVRSDLISAAEALIAQRGVDSVSLREITATAGALNASAVQYHFGGRGGLLRAVLAKHDEGIERARHGLLDAYVASDRDDLRELAGAYVRPLAAKLDDADGGHGYLQLLADLWNRPQPFADRAELERAEADVANSTTRWRSLVAPLLDPEAVRLHRRFVAMQFTVTDLARRARNRPDGSSERYTSHLIDLVAAILAAPLSEETRRTL